MTAAQDLNKGDLVIHPANGRAVVVAWIEPLGEGETRIVHSVAEGAEGTSGEHPHFDVPSDLEIAAA